MVLSLISCFAGGVFLAACLLDIIPDYLGDVNTELDARGLQVTLHVLLSSIMVMYVTNVALESSNVRTRDGKKVFTQSL